MFSVGPWNSTLRGTAWGTAAHRGTMGLVESACSVWEFMGRPGRIGPCFVQPFKGLRVSSVLVTSVRLRCDAQRISGSCRPWLQGGDPIGPVLKSGRILGIPEFFFRGSLYQTLSLQFVDWHISTDQSQIRQIRSLFERSRISHSLLPWKFVPLGPMQNVSKRIVVVTVWHLRGRRHPVL